MHRGGGGCADGSPSTSSLLALKPRQVVLVELERKLAMERKRPAQLKSDEQESLLICSIALWLENKGLPKLLRRFISATQVQDDWKARALNLNEVFSNYLDTRHDLIKDNTKKQLEEPGVKSAEQIGSASCVVSEGIVSEKKKKKKGDVPNINSERTSEDAAIKEKANDSNLMLQSEKNCKTNGTLSHGEQKPKKLNKSAMEGVCGLTPVSGDESVKKQIDKKKKNKSESTITDEKLLNAIPEVIKGKQNDLLSVASNDKLDSKVIVETKDKKKKKKMKTDDLVAEYMNCALGMNNEVFSDKNTSGLEALDSEKPIDTTSNKKAVEAAGVVVKESKKSSKKRKGLASDENEELPILNETVREAKRRKPDGVETRVTLPGNDGHADCHNKEEIFQVGREKQTGEILDVDPNIGADKPIHAKSAKKQHKTSAEPKTVNAFQRVKIEEVDYVDERLQDNSYWAKGGADSGYGAKAQEILGQVKGRGFRHEKTKKKRGSYRGGQIDLQSHSIKFNYADDD